MSLAPLRMLVEMMSGRRMKQLRADASVPHPVLVALSIGCGGCQAVVGASRVESVVYVPIQILLQFYRRCVGGRVWNHPCIMTTAIFYGFFQENNQCWKLCTGWGK
jgi:hypothetical protein